MVNSHGEVVEEGNCPTTDEDSELDKVCSGNLGVRPHLWGQVVFHPGHPGVKGGSSRSWRLERMGNMCSCSILCGAALGSFTLSLFRRMGRQNSDEWMQCKETFAYLHYVHGTISIYACQSVSQILGQPAQSK